MIYIERFGGCEGEMWYCNRQHFLYWAERSISYCTTGLLILFLKSNVAVGFLTKYLRVC
jgi:uncharacterized membrane protein